MITTIFSLLLSAAAAVATAGETVTIYQLDGSIRCQTTQATTPAEAAETLAAAGVKVISSDTRSVPFSLSGECGTPTGKANVLMVDAADWRALLKKRIDGLGFGEWIFDRPTVEVYKYDGSLQCKRGKEMALADMAEELTAAGVEVKSSRKGTDGLMHIAMCGASTGRLNVYTIATEALRKAQELGFKLLITRKMTNEIRPPLPARRGSAQPRTPPSEKTANQIPRLW
jgi:hypothetical protein